LSGLVERAPSGSDVNPLESTWTLSPVLDERAASSEEATATLPIPEETSASSSAGVLATLSEPDRTRERVVVLGWRHHGSGQKRKGCCDVGVHSLASGVAHQT
jgi:hypothetical protein